MGRYGGGRERKREGREGKYKRGPHTHPLFFTFFVHFAREKQV
jgi:hypothetical protein